ncbi:hypothetical protein AAY473_026622 [Plecturocebus cupreus]
MSVGISLHLFEFPCRQLFLNSYHLAHEKLFKRSYSKEKNLTLEPMIFPSYPTAIILAKLIFSVNLQRVKENFSFLSFFLKTGFHHVGQAGLELLTSGDLPALASKEHLLKDITGFQHPPVYNFRDTGFELLDSSDPPGLASESAGITDVFILFIYVGAQAAGVRIHCPKRLCTNNMEKHSASLAIIEIQNKMTSRWNLTLSLRLECSGAILAQWLTAVSASRVAGTTDAHHHARPVFVFLVETTFHHVAWASLELLSLSNLLASASQSVWSTGISHCTWSCSVS